MSGPGKTGGPLNRDSPLDHEYHIGVKGGTQVAPKLPEVGHVFGKGRFAVGVAQRLRAGEPAPDPCSVSVS